MTPSALCIIGSGYSAAALVLHLDARGAAMDGVTVIGPQALGAGQDRVTTAPDLYISKGDTHFAQASEIRMAVDWGLKLANENLLDNCGTVMGQFALGRRVADIGGDSLFESSDVGEAHAETHASPLPHDELVSLQRRAAQAGFTVGLV